MGGRSAQFGGSPARSGWCSLGVAAPPADGASFEAHPSAIATAIDAALENRLRIRWMFTVEGTRVFRERSSPTAKPGATHPGARVGAAGARLLATVGVAVLSVSAAVVEPAMASPDGGHDVSLHPRLQLDRDRLRIRLAVPLEVHAPAREEQLVADAREKPVELFGSRRTREREREPGRVRCPGTRECRRGSSASRPRSPTRSATRSTSRASYRLRDEPFTPSTRQRVARRCPVFSHTRAPSGACTRVGARNRRHQLSSPNEAASVRSTPCRTNSSQPSPP